MTGMTGKQKKMLIRILVAAVLIVFVNAVSLPKPVAAAVYLAAYLIIGWDVLRKAWRGIVNRRPFDECFLMTVATLGAIALAVYE